MPVASTSTAPAYALERVRRLTPPVAAFLAGAGPVALLGFSRGGYPVEVVAGYGVALWWLLLVGFLTNAIPRPSPSRAGWVAIGAAVLLVGWGLVSLSWSADYERGLTEVARAVVAAGSLLLGMSATRAGQARALAGGVLAGLSTIVAAGVLTRLFPDLVASATVTGELLASTRLRLAWPLNYWNGLGAAAAMAVPLAIVLASRARGPLTSGLALSLVPVVALGLAYTLSRAGVVALTLGVLVAVAVVAPRLLVARTAFVALVGASAALIAGLRPDALTDVVGGAAQTEAGRRAFVVVAIATVGVGLLQAGLRTADQAHWTPQVRRPGRRTAIGIGASIVVVLVAAALAFDVHSRASDGWDRFRDREVTASIDDSNTSRRLTSISGNGRYQMWSGAVDAFETHPLRGIGLGSWESWWNPRRDETGFVRNAHSEFFELLAETGLVGALSFLLLIGTPVAAGLRAAVRRAARDHEGVLVLPALVPFSAVLLVDWNWQLGALMVAGTTIAAAPLTRLDGAARGEPRSYGRVQRITAAGGLGLASVVAIAVLALSLVAPQAVDSSRRAAASGDLSRASAEAERGEQAASFAASPSLQLALVEEQAGDLQAAEAAALRATRRTPDDWRPWFVTARIAAARGDDRTALAAFRRAQRLNPNSPLLQP